MSFHTNRNQNRRNGTNVIAVFVQEIASLVKNQSAVTGKRGGAPEPSQRV